MENLPLKTGMVYGPVGSRRIGLSLGINLSPTEGKLCSLNCVYCHYGWTKVLSATYNISNPSFLDVNDLERQLEGFEVDRHLLDHITFSGNGEASQHPDFGRAVEIVAAFRDRHAPQAKTAILSNSSMVMRPEVRGHLLKLDRRIMKLDAGDEGTFLRINRPSKEVKFFDIIEGLKALGDYETQTLFVDGSVTNADIQSVESWLEVMCDLKPKSMQIYTLDRPPADRKLKAVSRERMRDIFLKAKKVGLAVKLH